MRTSREWREYYERNAVSLLDIDEPAVTGDSISNGSRHTAAV